LLWSQPSSTFSRPDIRPGEAASGGERLNFGTPRPYLRPHFILKGIIAFYEYLLKTHHSIAICPCWSGSLSFLQDYYHEKDSEADSIGAYSRNHTVRRLSHGLMPFSPCKFFN